MRVQSMSDVGQLTCGYSQQCKEKRRTCAQVLYCSIEETRRRWFAKALYIPYRIILSHAMLSPRLVGYSQIIFWGDSRERHSMQIVQFGLLYSDNILTVGVLVLFYSLFKIFGKTFQNEKKISEVNIILYLYSLSFIWLIPASYLRWTCR